jgi:hypothetical protein
MHPCSYALVDLESGELLLTGASDRPPVFGRLADTWVMAADPDGIKRPIPDPPPDWATKLLESLDRRLARVDRGNVGKPVG